MQELLESGAGVIALAVAALAAVRAWWNSGQARKLVEELADDVAEDLRDEISEAIAEGAHQVIEQVKEELAKAQRSGGLQ